MEQFELFNSFYLIIHDIFISNNIFITCYFFVLRCFWIDLMYIARLSIISLMFLITPFVFFPTTHITAFVYVFWKILQIQDLHSITPNSFLEISGAVIHSLSYQQVLKSLSTTLSSKLFGDL